MSESPFKEPEMDEVDKDPLFARLTMTFSVLLVISVGVWAIAETWTQ